MVLPAVLFLSALVLAIILTLSIIFFRKKPDRKKLLKILHKLAFDRNYKDSKVSVFQLLYKLKVDIGTLDSIIGTLAKEGVIKRDKEKISFTSFGKRYYDRIVSRKKK